MKDEFKEKFYNIIGYKEVKRSEIDLVFKSKLADYKHDFF